MNFLTQSHNSIRESTSQNQNHRTFQCRFSEKQFSSSNVTNQTRINQRLSKIPKITNDQKIIGLKEKIPNQIGHATTAWGIAGEDQNPACTTAGKDRAGASPINPTIEQGHIGIKLTIEPM